MQVIGLAELVNLTGLWFIAGYNGNMLSLAECTFSEATPIHYSTKLKLAKGYLFLTDMLAESKSTEA
jgi:hypothetical protein